MSEPVESWPGLIYRSGREIIVSLEKVWKERSEFRKKFLSNEKDRTISLAGLQQFIHISRKLCEETSFPPAVNIPQIQEIRFQGLKECQTGKAEVRLTDDPVSGGVIVETPPLRDGTECVMCLVEGYVEQALFRHRQELWIPHELRDNFFHLLVRDALRWSTFASESFEFQKYVERLMATNKVNVEHLSKTWKSLLRGEGGLLIEIIIAAGGY